MTTKPLEEAEVTSNSQHGTPEASLDSVSTDSTAAGSQSQASGTSAPPNQQDVREASDQPATSEAQSTSEGIPEDSQSPQEVKLLLFLEAPGALQVSKSLQNTKEANPVQETKTSHSHQAFQYYAQVKEEMPQSKDVPSSKQELALPNLSAETQPAESTAHQPSGDANTKIDANVMEHTNTEAQANTQVDANVDGDANTKIDANIKDNANIKGETNTQVDANVTGDANNEGEANSQVDANIEGDANIKIDANVNIDTNVEVDENAVSLAAQPTVDAKHQPDTQVANNTEAAPEQPGDVEALSSRVDSSDEPQAQSFQSSPGCSPAPSPVLHRMAPGRRPLDSSLYMANEENDYMRSMTSLMGGGEGSISSLADILIWSEATLGLATSFLASNQASVTDLLQDAGPSLRPASSLLDSASSAISSGLSASTNLAIRSVTHMLETMERRTIEGIRTAVRFLTGHLNPPRAPAGPSCD